MSVTVTDINPTRKELVVTLTPEQTSQIENDLLAVLRKEAKVPGFRPGKAPVHLLRQKFKEYLQVEFPKGIVRKAFDLAEKVEGLKIYNLVEQMGGETAVAGQEANINFTVDVIPQFELPAYKGIAVNVSSTDVDDAEIEEMLQNIRRQRSDYVEVEAPAKENDYVKLSYTGKLDGLNLADVLPDEPAAKKWGTQTNTWEQVQPADKEHFGVPVVVESLAGMSKGDTKTVEYTLPDTFAYENYRGKVVSYDIEVHEVREQVLPEINEEFLKGVQAESLEDLKAKILDSLESRKIAEQSTEKRKQVLEFLVNSLDFPLPESAVEAETNRNVTQIMDQNIQRGVPMEEFEQNKGALFAQAENMARREVKQRFILARIAEEEDIKVEENDFSNALMAIAQQNRVSPDEIVKELKKDRSKVMDLQRQILLSKTLDFIVQQTKLSA